METTKRVLPTPLAPMSSVKGLPLIEEKSCEAHVLEGGMPDRALTL